MSACWGPITVERALHATTHQARSVVTLRSAVETASFRMQLAAVSVSLVSHVTFDANTFVLLNTRHLLFLHCSMDGFYLSKQCDSVDFVKL